MHNWGDLTSSLGSQNISTTDAGVGTHFNPFGAPHGCDSPGSFQSKHVGDIGNYTAAQGATPFNQFTSSLLDLSYTNRSIIGRAVVLHAEPDHCVQPTGNAGTPIRPRHANKAGGSRASLRPARAHAAVCCSLRCVCVWRAVQCKA